MEQVCTREALESGYRKVKQNSKKGSKRRRVIETFGEQLEKYLSKLSKSLKMGSYRPKPHKRQMIPKSGGGERALSIPEIDDQIVQTALNEALQPIFEPTFSDCSYGYRKGTGAREALSRVDELLKAGFVAVVDADIEKFFDSIPQERLLDQVGRKVKDGRVIKLIRAFLTAGYMQEGQFYLQELGTPQGAVISPLLANIYLDPMDRWIAAQGRYELVRYADDFVILCRTMEEAEDAKTLTESWMEKAGLGLNAEKTEVKNVNDGFCFLGFYLQGKEVRLPQRERVENIKQTIRAATTRSKTSIAEMIKSINDHARGWYDYYKLSTDPQPFLELDTLIRERLKRKLSYPSIRRDFQKLDPNSQKVFSPSNSYTSHCHSYIELQASQVTDVSK